MRQSSWPILLAHYQQEFDQFLAMHRQELRNARFTDAPEILPGWNLRLNIHADGQGYDLLLQDMTDKGAGTQRLRMKTPLFGKANGLIAKFSPRTYFSG